MIAMSGILLSQLLLDQFLFVFVNCSNECRKLNIFAEVLFTSVRHVRILRVIWEFANENGIILKLACVFQVITTGTVLLLYNTANPPHE